MKNSKSGTATWGIRWADALLLFTALLWGVNFSVVKFALAELSPLAFNGIRFLVASLTMLVLAGRTGRDFSFHRRHVVYLIGLGLVGHTAYQLFFVFGVAQTTADNTSLIYASVPVWVALFGIAIGAEQVEPKGWLGVVLSLLGTFLIIWGSDRAAQFQFGGASLRGDLLILAATLCWSLYTLLLRPITRHYSSVSIATFTTTVGTIPLVLVAMPSLTGLNWALVPAVTWGALLFSAVFAIALSYLFWNYGVSRLGSTRTSLYSNLTAPVALITAWLWLGETLTTLQSWGVIIGLSGVILARRYTYPTSRPC